MTDQHSLNRLRRLQWRFVIGWAILSLAFTAWGLVRMSIDRTPSVEAGRFNLDMLMPWWTASAMTWTALTVMAWMLWRGAVPTKLRAPRRAAMVILLVAFAARIVVLTGHDPALSDDIYRYVMDGRNLAHGHNPYMDTPAERAGFHAEGVVERPLSVIMLELDAGAIEERWPGEAELLPLVNNPEMHTIYLPTSQYVFAGAAILIDGSSSDPDAGAHVFRCIVVGFEVLAILLLLAVLGFRGQSVWWAALYAWHPLPLSEIAGSGHQDSIGIALMMAAFALFAVVPRRVWTWTIALALATLVKPMVLPVVAFMLKDVSLSRYHGQAHDGTPHPASRSRPWVILLACMRNWKAWLISLVVGATVCTALAGPLWFTHGGEPLENLTQTSTRFSTKWAHFGSVYETTLWTIRVFDPLEDPEIQWRKKDRQEWQARLVCLALVALVCLVAFFCPADAWNTSRAVLFAMVLFSTTSHPWYLLWALILLPAAFSPAVWVASLTLLLGYAQLGDVVEWTTPAWVMWVAYVPVYAVLVIDLAIKAAR